MDIEYLINNLALVITYLASGFVFIKTLLYVRNSEDDATHNSHYILPSIVVSYIIKLAFDLILSAFDIELSEGAFWAMLLVIAVVLGVIFGKLSKSKFVEKYMVKWFHRSANISFWSDTPRADRYYTIKYKGSDSLYQGCIFETEAGQRFPLIKMYCYSFYDDSTGEIEDHTKDEDSEIILPTENIEYIKSASIKQNATK